MFFDKGKLLALARDRMTLSRQQMAKALNVDLLHLAQMENGRRKVDEFFVWRAQELVRAFEKRNQ